MQAISLIGPVSKHRTTCSAEGKRLLYVVYEQHSDQGPKGLKTKQSNLFSSRINFAKFTQRQCSFWASTDCGNTDWKQKKQTQGPIGPYRALQGPVWGLRWDHIENVGFNGIENVDCNKIENVGGGVAALYPLPRNQHFQNTCAWCALAESFVHG